MKMIPYIPAAVIALAGLIHLGIAPEHYAHAPAHGVFFVLAGVAEILWALAFWRRPTPRRYHLGLALAGGLIVLWAVTRVLPAPFGHGPEPVNASGLVCKASELIGVLSLVMLAAQGQLMGAIRQPPLRPAGEALALALVVGLVSYGVGYAATPLLPTLGPQEEPAHEEHMQGESAHEHEAPAAGPTVVVGELRIEGAWAWPATAGGTAAIYLTVVNGGHMADALVAAHSEVAQAVEFHEMRMEGDVMHMQPVSQLEVPAHGQIALQPGDGHLMLIGLKRDLAPGDQFPLGLRFASGIEVTIMVEVRQP